MNASFVHSLRSLSSQHHSCSHDILKKNVALNRSRNKELHSVTVHYIARAFRVINYFLSTFSLAQAEKCGIERLPCRIVAMD